MAFYNPTYPTSNYNSYQAAYSPPPTFSPPPLQPDSPIIWVQGIAGAKAYPVQNNKMVVLFDSEDKRFFIKSTDASGIPQPLRVFDYTESSENKCISYYLQDIDKENTLFVALAQMDNFKLADLFEKRVIDALDISIQKAIDNPSSQAAKWLSISLEMALQQPDFLPADKPLHKFIEQLSNKEDIHVLYPMRNGNAAASCRYSTSSSICGNGTSCIWASDRSIRPP